MLILVTNYIAKGQAGSLSLGTPTTSPTTGLTQFDVFWTQNQLTEATGVRIEINIASNPSGEVVCVNPLSVDAASVHSDFAGYASHSNSQVLILRLASTPFGLQNSYSPRLITVYFRAAPGATVEVTFGLARVLTGGAPSYYDIDEPLSPLQVTVPDPIKVGGIIRKVSGADASCENGQDFGISDVDVTFDADAMGCFPVYNGYPTEPYSFTSLDGYYFVDVPSHYVYTITPWKNSDCSCGLDDGDVDDIRNIILGYETDPSLADLLAADFNANGVVTTFDIVGITQCRNGTWNPPAGWTSWRFIPVDDYEANDPPSGTINLLGLPSSIITPPVTYTLSTEDFYGIKRGDMDGSCSDCDDEFPFASPSEDRSLASPIFCKIEDKSVRAGEEIMLPVTATVDGAAVFSLAMEVDKEASEVLAVEKGNLSDDYLQYSIGLHDNIVHCRVMWFTMTPGGEELPDKGALFNLRLRAKKDLKSLKSSIWQVAERGSNNIYYENGTTKSPLRLKFNDANGEFFARLTGPNPTNAGTQITLYLPAASLTEAMIYDVNGRLRKSLLYDLAEGYHQIEVSDIPFEPGVYTLLLNTAHGQFTTRLVKF